MRVHLHHILILIACMSIAGLAMASKQVTVSGYFINLDPDESGFFGVKLNYASYRTQDQEEVSAYPDSNGHFSIQLNESLPNQLIFLNIGKYYHGYILVNNDLQLTIDAKKVFRMRRRQGNAIEFSGTDADRCKLIHQHYRNHFDSKFHSGRGDLVFRSKKEYSEQLSDVIALYSTAFKTLEDAIDGYPSHVAKVIRDEFTAQYLEDVTLISIRERIPAPLFGQIIGFRPQHHSMHTLLLNKYLAYHLNFKEMDVFIHTIRKVNQDASGDPALEAFFTDYSKRMSGTDFDKARYSAGYKRFVNDRSHLIYAINIEQLIDTLAYLKIDTPDVILCASVPKTIDTRRICYERTYDLLQTAWGRELYDSFHRDDQRGIALLDSIRTIEIEQTPFGELLASSDDHKHYRATHDTITELIDNIRNTYSGKVVIIDLWATWCGPCIADMKRSTGNKKTLKANGIQVVYLCEGRTSNANTWLEMSVNMHLSGDHIFLSPELTVQLLEAYGLSYYPSYLIIDARGEFHINPISGISSANAKRIQSKYGAK